MEHVASILSLIAGIGIFLIACSMMSRNLEALGSKKLKALFVKANKSKLFGVLIGTTATAVIQSSSAATVMTIGFVNAGIMTLAQAATVIFGANVGTTVTGQLVALGLLGDGAVSASVVFAALSGVGAFIMIFAKKDRAQKIGAIVAGFGMLFVGLSMMSESMASFAESDPVKRFLALFKNPLLLVFVGMLLTAVIQSSSVMTSITITMVTTGLLTLDQGIYLTMGSNVGTCVTALIAGLTGTINAKLAALVHLIFNIGGVGVFMLAGLFMRVGGLNYGDVFSAVLPDKPQLQLAMFHTVFNVVAAIVALPLTDALVKLVTRLVPDNRREKQTRIAH